MWFALFLTFFAGMSTVFGGILVTHRRMLSRGTLATALGFSAGAMLYVSFTDILQKSVGAFQRTESDKVAYAYMVSSFFVGILIMVFLNRLIHRDINPNEQEGVDQKTIRRNSKRRLLHSGLFIAAALCLHNFPEGFLVFMSALDDPSVGIAIAVALAIHNIPEGIAIAAPIYAASGKRLRTIGVAALAGIAEPIGAIIGYVILQDFLTNTVLGWTFGVVAGMMIFICIDELLPAAKRYETSQYQTTYGFIAGMAVIAVSLAILI